MTANRTPERRQSPDAAVEALDGMEPELRQLAGLVRVLRVLGEAADAIDPVAISAIARAAGTPLDKVERAWRTAISDLRGD